MKTSRSPALSWPARTWRAPCQRTSAEVGGAFEAGGEAFGAHVGVHGFVVAAFKEVAEFVFEGEGLDGADGGHAFGCGGSQCAFAAAGAAAGFVDEAAAVFGGVPHDGQRDEGE